MSEVREAAASGPSRAGAGPGAHRPAGAPSARRCPSCGEAFVVSAAEQAFLAGLAARRGGGWSLPTHCGPCRAARRARREIVDPATPPGWYERVCTLCGKGFSFGPKDVEYYAARGYRWPRRCKSCRSVVVR